MYFLLEMWIFYCYVSSPEGKLRNVLALLRWVQKTSCAAANVFQNRWMNCWKGCCKDAVRKKLKKLWSIEAIQRAPRKKPQQHLGWKETRKKKPLLKQSIPFPQKILTPKKSIYTPPKKKKKQLPVLGPLAAPRMYLKSIYWVAPLFCAENCRWTDFCFVKKHLQPPTKTAPAPATVRGGVSVGGDAGGSKRNTSPNEKAGRIIGGSQI